MTVSVLNLSHYANIHIQNFKAIRSRGHWGFLPRNDPSQSPDVKIFIFWMTVLAPTSFWHCYHMILKYQILKSSGCVCVSARMYVLVNRKPPDLYKYGSSGQDVPPTSQDNCVTLGCYSLALYFKVIIWTIVDLNGHNDCALYTFSGFLLYPTLLIWGSLGVVFPSISVQCYGTYKMMFLSWIFFSLLSIDHF